MPQDEWPATPQAYWFDPMPSFYFDYSHIFLTSFLLGWRGMVNNGYMWPWLGPVRCGTTRTRRPIRLLFASLFLTFFDSFFGPHFCPFFPGRLFLKATILWTTIILIPLNPQWVPPAGFSKKPAPDASAAAPSRKSPDPPPPNPVPNPSARSAHRPGSSP